MWWAGSSNASDYLNYEHYIGFEESLEYLKEVFKTQGPFDGILGFSQGGVMAAILCGMLGQPGSNISFKFAMLFSAYATKVKRLREHYKQVPKAFPTLQVFGGEKDTFVPPESSRELAGLFPKDVTTIYEHKGGHYIPVTAEAKKIYKAWIEKVAQLNSLL